MYSLQTTTTIEVNNQLHTFSITNQGDFRMVLDCFNALGDEKLSEDYRVLACLLIFYNELNSYEDLETYKDCLEFLIKDMYKFFNGGEEQVRGIVTHDPLIDWEGDSQMIVAAINNVAHKEIRTAEYLHWWTFLGYYISVGESLLSTVVSIRSKIVKNKTLEKWEKEFKRDNPQYFVWKRTTVEDREAEDIIRTLWNQGGD